MGNIFGVKYCTRSVFYVDTSFGDIILRLKDAVKEWTELLDTVASTGTKHESQVYSKLIETEAMLKDIISNWRQSGNHVLSTVDHQCTETKGIKDISKQDKHEHMRELELENKQLHEERNSLLRRLSKLVGEKLTLDNPAIADLNDKNRPTKLGEMYSELYDNEWTDAFDALTEAKYTDKEAVTTLCLTLMNVLEFCDSNADKLLQQTADAVILHFEEYNKSAGQGSRKLADCNDSSLPIKDQRLQLLWKPPKETPRKVNQHQTKEQLEVQPVNVDNKIKYLRKEVSEATVPILQKVYIDANWDRDCIGELMPFIKRCLFIGWMMVVQSPPLCLHTISPSSDEPFDTVKYRHYTKTGPVFDYLVWPALLLHKDGPLVTKGVAQAR